MADTRHLGWHGIADEAPAPTTDPRVGLVVSERYRIERKIGQGGMGSVFEGTHLLIERRVAIKCLHPQYADDDDAVRRFHNEARAVSAIGHPHIVEAIDMGRMDDGTLYLVFEFLEGRDLATVLENESLSVEESLRIVMRVCDALEAAHTKGIIHRDLKPENIFLTKRPDDPHFVKILDFGISKLGIDAISDMTVKGAVMGTPHYMSPEQASGKEVDLRTDLYALGVVLYAMLSGGTLPFDADSLPALMMKICTERPPPLGRSNPEVPAAIVAVVDRLLEKRREDRFASAVETKAALEAAQRGEGVPSAATVRSGRPVAMNADTPAASDVDSAVEVDPAVDVAIPVKSRPWLPLLAGGLLVVAGVLWATWPSENETPAPAAPPTVAPEAEAQLEARPEARPGETSPEPATVEIQISASPPGARATLDGLDIELPHTLEAAASERMASLEVRLEGYETETREISLRASGFVTVELARRDAAPRAMRSRPSMEPAETPMLEAEEMAPEVAPPPQTMEPESPPAGLKRIRL
ncbi:MAG: serine/threonine-protein kinase [Myxococcota bacterium]